MSAKPVPRRPEKLGLFQVLTLFLSIYVLAALFLQTVFPLPPETNHFLDQIDFYVCLVFLADFFHRLYHAPSKAAFLRWGWIDFLSSIPMLESLRVGRMFRIIRIFRILRAFRSTKHLVNYLLRNHKATPVVAVACIAFILLIFSSVAMLQFETSPEANIKTPGDAFWWAYATLATVGYGDKFPLSTEGRIVACILMTAGVGLFGTFTGFVASTLVEPEIEKEDDDIKKLAHEVRELRNQISSLDRKLSADAGDA